MRKRKSLASFVLPGLGMMSLAAFACTGTAQKNRPNIILILADDMGFSDIGCFGSEIKTQNLDNLAYKGIRMTQFYNASRSCPSRASLLTGLYQHQAGVGDMVSDLGYSSYQGYLNDNCVTLAEALKYDGYTTYMSGKWHVGGKPEVHPLKRGFNRYFGLIDGAGSYFERKAYRINQQPPVWMLDSIGYNPPETGFYMTDAITDHAISFLKEGPHKEDPFFLYLAYTAPHWPLHALPEDIAKYRGSYLKGWDVIREERYRRMMKMGIINESSTLSPLDEMAPDWDTLSDEDKDMWDLRMAVYAAMIDRLDQNIGRIVNYLTESGKINNTMIIFMADNGGCHEQIKNRGNYLPTSAETGTRESFDSYEYPWANVSNTPFRKFKHWVHEGGISTPFIAFFPGRIPGGQVYHQPGHIIDIMPTLLDISGGIYPEEFNGRDILPMEGISLLPVFSGKNTEREKPLFWEHEGNRAVRDGEWKLVSEYDYTKKEFKRWELYNLSEDRSEIDDLSSRNPDLRDELIREYEEWSARSGVVSREVIDSRK
jgi:arylsulfatase A-like enzyme